MISDVAMGISGVVACDCRLGGGGGGGGGHVAGPGGGGGSQFISGHVRR